MVGGVSNEFAIAWFIMIVFPLIIEFIPIFHLSFLLLKKQEVNKTASLVISFVIGLLIALYSQDYIGSALAHIKYNNEPLPVIALPLFVILEIVIVFIHFQYQKRGKIQKRPLK